MTEKAIDSYLGFEQGPIRPPSEAYSLLVRVTRNCPWNQCTFCPVYKGTKFSRRPVDHVKGDIDEVFRHVEAIRELADESGRVPRSEISRITQNIDPQKSPAFVAAFNWYFAGGLKSVFIQDANSLIVKPSDLVEILKHLKKRFPQVERITSYARSQTVSRMKEGDLKAIGDAGLNRIHIGLESGSDEVLKMVKKGVTKEMHIQAGIRVKKAGIELSEYYMPGLGGRKHLKEHALETADALNQITPDFIRMRTLAIPNHAPLFEDWQAGRFEKCTDLMVVKEILIFIENLDEITSVVKSDHILNLFQDLEGTLPQDKDHMLEILRTFLATDPERQRLYQVGRRIGVFSGLGDMENPHRMARAKKAYSQLGNATEDIDKVTDEFMGRFI
ncbi:MAG: radical SAM protein [candidate division Zixibacteria bacterium]|nr:radical SAM protein [candidate division Zixibacteria bacterium]